MRELRGIGQGLEHRESGQRANGREDQDFDGVAAESFHNS
jgi:hypothetical protein